MLTVSPPRAFSPETEPFAHLSLGSAGSKYKSSMVLWTSISAMAAENLIDPKIDKAYTAKEINGKNFSVPTQNLHQSEMEDVH